MEVTQNDDGSYSMVVDGEEVSFPSLEALAVAASKGAAADARFREAASVKKEVEDFLKKAAPDLRVVASLRKARETGDMGVAVEAMKGLGYSDDELNPYLQDTSVQPASRGRPVPKAQADDGLTADEAAELKDFRSFFGELRRQNISPDDLVKSIAADRHSRGKAQIKEKLIAGIDSDENLARIFKKGSAGHTAMASLAEAILSHKFVEGEAKGVDDASISLATRDANALVKRLLESLPQTGNGSTSIGGTPSSLSGLTGNPPKPIKRPPIDSNSQERGSYFEQRIAQIAEEAAHPNEG